MTDPSGPGGTDPCDDNPFHTGCVAANFPSIVDSAADQVESAGTAHLSQSARRALYRYGHRYKADFEAPANQGSAAHDRLVASLAGRLTAAVPLSSAADSADTAFHPPRIDEQGLSAVMGDANPWHMGG